MRISTEKGILVIKGILIEFGSEVEKNRSTSLENFSTKNVSTEIFRTHRSIGNFPRNRMRTLRKSADEAKYMKNDLLLFPPKFKHEHVDLA